MEIAATTTTIDAKLGCLSKPDGSSEFSISKHHILPLKIQQLGFNNKMLQKTIKIKTNVDDTCQMCAVYGPGEVKMMKESAERAYVNVIYKPRVGIPSMNAIMNRINILFALLLFVVVVVLLIHSRCVQGNRERVLEYSIRSICDGVILSTMHPRTAINIVIQEIQNDGNYLACALNSACLALLDANVPMKFTFASVSCAMSKQGAVVFFPSLRQERDECLVTATFLFDSISNESVSVTCSGPSDLATFQRLMAAAKQYAAEKIFPLYTQLVAAKYNVTLQ